MSVLFQELRELIRAFNADGIEFALCGGLAVAVYGVVRATQDIDLLIREESLDDAYRTAAGLGFDIRGLIKMKRQSGRPQDLADVERLENEDD